MFTKTIGLVILCAWLCDFTRADIFEQCEGKDNMYVSSEQSCSHYIFCYGEESFESDCEEDSPYFSEVDQTCDTDPSVCKYGSTFNETLVDYPSDQDGDVLPVNPVNPPVNPVNPPVNPVNPPVNSVNPPVNPVNPPVNPVNPPVNPVNPPVNPVNPPNPSVPQTVATAPPPIMSSPLPTSHPATSVPSTTAAATHMASSCPLTDDPLKIVFLPDPKSCSDYFMCYHGEPLPMHCSNMLHFDIKTQKCDYPEEVRCQSDSASPREKCQVHTVDVYPHPTNCNYYYMCRNGYLMVMQCPTNMFWDEEKRACVLRAKTKCNATVQRANIFKMKAM